MYSRSYYHFFVIFDLTSKCTNKKNKVFVDNWSLKHLLYFEHCGCAVVPEKSRVF
jgi:hypothetical protein